MTLNKDYAILQDIYMSLVEKMSDDLYVGSLNSLGYDLPPFLAQAALAAGINLETGRIPAPRVDLENKYQTNFGPFHAGHLDRNAQPPILYISRAALLGHAQQIWQSLDKDALGVSESQSTNQHAVELAETLGLPISMFDRGYKLENFCTRQALVALALQATGLNETEQKLVEDKFLEMNY